MPWSLRGDFAVDASVVQHAVTAEPSCSIRARAQAVVLALEHAGI